MAAKQNISSEHFISRYLQESDFPRQRTPLQVYPLEEIQLRVPTPLLRADYHYLIFLQEGTFTQQVGLEVHHLLDSTVLYVPQGEAFAIRSLGSGITGYFLMMEEKVAFNLVQKMEGADLLSLNTVTHLEPNTRDWLLGLCQLLHTELTQAEPDRKVSNGLLLALMHKLMGLNDGGQNVSRQREIAQQFKRLLHREMKEHKLVAYYAQELGVSENYLNRCVSSHFRRSCKQMIQEAAVLQSQLLMFESTKDISEIAFAVGYDDPSHFSRIFKQVTGETPTAFKKRTLHGLS